MEYAYEDVWKNLKTLVIRFIKHIQNEEYDKALALTYKNSQFFSDNYTIPIEELLSTRSSNGVYINPNHKEFTWEQNPNKPDSTIKEIGKMEPDKFDVSILKRILKDVDSNNMKFFLAPIGNSEYYMMIPYKDGNTTKYLYIDFVHCFKPAPVYYGKPIFIPIQFHKSNIKNEASRTECR